MISKRSLGFALVLFLMWIFHEKHESETPFSKEEKVVDRKLASVRKTKTDKRPNSETPSTKLSGRECLKQLTDSEEVKAARAAYVDRLRGRLPAWILREDPNSDNSWNVTDVMSLYASMGYAGLMKDENIPLNLDLAEVLNRVYFENNPECMNLSFIILKGITLEKQGKSEELADLLSVSNNYRCAHLDFLQGDLAETLMAEATTPEELIVAKSMIDQLPKIDYDQITDFLKRHNFSAPAREVNVAGARGERDSYLRNEFFENDPDGINFRRQISEYFTPEYKGEIFDPAKARQKVDSTNWQTLSDLETPLSKSCSLETLRFHAENFRSSVNFWLIRKKEAYDKLDKLFIDPRSNYGKR